MLSNGVIELLLIWGIWLLVPFIVDGASTLYNLIVSFVSHYRKANLDSISHHNTKVSVIIPAYNEEINIDRCLLSIKSQTYPHKLMEIVVVDDGSSDGTVNKILSHMGSEYPADGFRTHSFSIYAPKFNGVINVIRRKREQGSLHGKAAAVNAAIDQITGDIVIAIDSDIVLAPDAIENAVKEFNTRPNMIAATGHLIIDPYLVIDKDKAGKPLRNEYGMALSKELNPSEKLLTASQFLEYATTFHLGRQTESATNTMFTMAGACAMFRREAFELVGKYQGRTVSEDADMTLALHEVEGKQINYLSNVRVHLAPVLSWATLYSQRTRWQRGALEVAATYHFKKNPKQPNFSFWRIALPLRLQVDHTLAMPRLVWTFMMFILPMFGYSWETVRNAYLLLLGFYIILSFMRVLGAYNLSSPPEKVLVRRYLGYTLFIPLYNTFLFYTRMSAILRTITEESSWTVENDFIKKFENGSVYRTLVSSLSYTLGVFF